MLPWALAMPVLKRVVPIPRLVGVMAAGRRSVRDERREERVAKAAWWASRVQLVRFPENCLERSLVAYRFLGRAGADPTLVLGVAKEGGSVIGHAWILVDGAPVQDPAGRIEAYTPVMAFGPTGGLLADSGDTRLDRLASPREGATRS